MSIRRTWRPVVLLLAAAAWLCTLGPVQAEQSRLATYDQTDGSTVFALSVSPKIDQPHLAPRSIVVLIDTSASQTGTYRHDSLSSLVSLLNGLKSKDQVQIMAADLAAVPMMDKLSDSRSEASRSAFAKLRSRAPLGSTDMYKVLTTAQRALAASPKTARRIVYIGDGVSNAGKLDQERFKKLIDGLVADRISVSSLAIGPKCNVELLSTIANHTGGNVIVDTDRTSAQEVGTLLAKATRGVVAWPKSVKLPSGIAESFPTAFPPMRADRDSILVGSLKRGEAMTLTVETEIEGQSEAFDWTLNAEKSNEDFAYLARLVDLARKDQGIRLPTAGSTSLREVRRVMVADATNLSEIGSRALASGDVSAAKALADAALANDPTNTTADVIRDAVKRREDKSPIKFMQLQLGGETAEEPPLRIAPIEAEGEGSGFRAPVPSAPIIEGALETPIVEGAYIESAPINQGIIYGAQFNDGTFGDSPMEFDRENGQFLDEVEQRRRAAEALLKVEVRNGIADGRDSLGSNPDGAVSELKLLLETVRAATDVSADVRGQLTDQVQSAIRAGMRRGLEKSYRDARIAENQSQARDRLRIAKAMQRREQRTRQIIDRFNALVDEGRYEEAESAAIEVEKIDPSNVVAQTAILSSRLGGRVTANRRILDLEERGIWRTLNLVDEARIPFPDEPPLVYPDPEFWEELTIRREKYASIDLAKPGGAEEAIFKELERFEEVDYIDTPLTEVIADIKERHNNINIILNTAALELAGIDPEETISKTLSGIKLRNALRLMLKDLELTYVVQDEVLSITTLEQAEQQLITKVYPVGDLVLPIINIGGGGGVGGGGLGGQLNGGGLGGGGGGFGGGGGGFGGGGGGLGGGGFGGGGGGFFDIDDPISLGSKSEAAVKTTTPASIPATTPKPTRGKAITLDLEKMTAETAWQRYFARQAKLPAADQVSDSDIKATVARRMNSGQFKETVSLMNAALAHGFARPWMYEAVGLAMEAAGEPKSEIERALMSAIDLTSDMNEVYYIATYMARIGLEERAFSLLQQVAESNPTQPEPFALAMKLAKSMDNPEALKWACVGVLQNAWPDSEREIAEDAFRTAKATYAELIQTESKKTIAEELRDRVNNAMVRDCVVKVSWTGDADVDVLVQEPSGSVCSIQNQRTTAGGVLLGDNSSIKRSGDNASTEPVSETYVCSKGFSGTYKVLVRPVWGDVAAGKVNVEVRTNFGTKGEQVISRSVKLGDEASMVVFNLDHGRRTDPIEEQLIHNSAQKQIEVGRAILAQQLDSGSSETLQDLAFDRAIGNRLLPRRIRGGVGFRPVITTLPNGTNLNVTTAVISADRRYVRISPSPNFSGVTEVSTFNFVTGDGTTMPNQGGGAGAGGLGGAGAGGGF